jgi:hypothetical protein
LIHGGRGESHGRWVHRRRVEERAAEDGHRQRCEHGQRERPTGARPFPKYTRTVKFLPLTIGKK